MQKLVFFTLFLLLGFSFVSAQKSHSCCDPGGTSATATFASLGNSSDFRGSHEIPVAYTLENARGENITFSTPDGKEAQGYLVKSEAETNKYIFVFHEWWGLNDYIRREADRLQADLEEVNVIALDLYDGKVATTREEASELMQANTAERSQNIIKGALEMVGADAEIATIGWCFGGGWSLQAALLLGEQNVGCNMYYGMPETDVEKLKTLNGPVLGIFAAEDEWINAEVVATFEENMKAADQPLTTEVYAANHAFANPSSPRYNEEAAKNAYKNTIRFLADVLNL